MGCGGSKDDDANSNQKKDESNDAAYDLKSKAKIADRKPIGVEVEEGKTYYYCTCGASKTQPFCDGSHVEFNKENGTNFAPMEWKAEKSETKYFCMCKRTSTAPFCDGTHQKLPPEEESADKATYDLKSKAKIADRKPVGVEVEEGKTYYWCTCGASKTQPFCDGSHVEFNAENGTNFTPLAWTADSTETKYFCLCKRTEAPPFCDGAHRNLPAEEVPPTEDKEAYDLKSKARIADRKPMGVEVEEGKMYYWCTCGASKTQPFCDGSHVEFNAENGTNFTPLAWTAESTETKYFCLCKRTANAPFCDGAHLNLPAEDEN